MNSKTVYEVLSAFCEDPQKLKDLAKSEKNEECEKILDEIIPYPKKILTELNLGVSEIYDSISEMDEDYYHGLTRQMKMCIMNADPRSATLLFCQTMDEEMLEIVLAKPSTFYDPGNDMYFLTTSLESGFEVPLAILLQIKPEIFTDKTIVHIFKRFDHRPILGDANKFTNESIPEFNRYMNTIRRAFQCMQEKMRKDLSKKIAEADSELENIVANNTGRAVLDFITNRVDYVMSNLMDAQNNPIEKRFETIFNDMKNSPNFFQYEIEDKS